MIDFTAGYHQTPLHPDSQEYTAFITQYGLFEWNRVAMSLKGSGPFFQRSMANNALQGYVTRICEIYIDDVLLFGTTDDEYIDNTHKVLKRYAFYDRINRLPPETEHQGIDSKQVVHSMLKKQV
jgi:hypothetical protein